MLKQPIADGFRDPNWRGGGQDSGVGAGGPYFAINGSVWYFLMAIPPAFVPRWPER